MGKISKILEVIVIDCEMCGSAPAKMKARVDGAVMKVCDNCSDLGEVLGEIKKEKPVKVKKKRNKSKDYFDTKTEKVLREDYGQVVRSAREKKDWKIEDLAQRLKEKASVVKRIEHGDLKPNKDLIKKLEHELELELYEEVERKKFSGSSGGDGVTIGDVVDIK
ncbi:MAG: multiprotein bridging factor aMBF1 [Candidatus Aenigmatarchaeota archaeon]